MTGLTFTLYRIVHLPEEGSRYRAWAGDAGGAANARDGGVFTQLDLRRVTLRHGYRHGSVEHRRGARLDGLANGEPFHEVVRVEKFPVYYRRDLVLLVAATGVDLSRAAVRRLQGGLAGEIFLVPIALDLPRLLDSLPDDTIVRSAWSTGATRGPVRARAIFGPDLSRAEEFRRMRPHLSSATLVLPYGGARFKVGVARSGSFRLLEPRELRDCLRLAEHLAGFDAASGDGSGSRPTRKRRAAEVA